MRAELNLSCSGGVVVDRKGVVDPAGAGNQTEAVDQTEIGA